MSLDRLLSEGRASTTKVFGFTIVIFHLLDQRNTIALRKQVPHIGA